MSLFRVRGLVRGWSESSWPAPLSVHIERRVGVAINARTLPGSAMVQWPGPSQTTRRRREVTANGAAASRVYDDLRARIVRWEIAPGETLRESDIAMELDVSRTPVREALQRLRAEGLVAAKGRRGSEVPVWTRQELDDSYRVRANLEAWAARLATERRDNLDLPRLHSLADEMTQRSREADVDLDRIAELNIEFHQLISTGAGSFRLVQMLSRVVHMPLLYKVFHTFTPAQVKMTLLEHHTILMAIDAGDVEWAEAITKAHILAALSSLMSANEIFEPGPSR